MYVSPPAPPELMTMNRHGSDGIQCPLLASEKTLKRVEYNCIGGGGSYKGGSGPSDRSARHRTIKCRVPKMSTWWDHLNIILPHVCAIQVCIYVDGGSYDDPKIDWLEADPFKWSVIIDLV